MKLKAELYLGNKARERNEKFQKTQTPDNQQYLT
jgi:hypothetical protein